MKPEAKFAVIATRILESRHVEIVASSTFAYIVMVMMVAEFGIVEKAVFNKFPFSFAIKINPIYDFYQVLDYIQENLNIIEEAMNDD